MAALGAQIGVGNRRALLLTAEAVREPWIGLEPGRAAIKLPRMAQHHSRTAVHAAHHSTYVNIHIAVLAQLSNGVAVLAEADDGEPAMLVGGVGRAHVEKPRTIGKLH